MKWFCRLSLWILVFTLISLGNARFGVAGQKKGSKADQAVAENQALDNQWLAAFNSMDVDKVMSCYWQSPDLILIDPDGSVAKGWENARKSYQDLFSMVDSVHFEITDSSHRVAGDGVIGYVSGVFHVKPKGAPMQMVTIRGTDFRQKMSGKWVYVQDHAHAVMPPSGPKPTDSLYKRLGGYDAIAAVTDDLAGRLVSDPQLGRFFQGVSRNSVQRIRQLLVDQLCQATGGPCVYIGRDMKTAHAGLGIGGSDWDQMVKLMGQTLDKFNVPDRERGELLNALSSLRADIVEK
jgi:hemoglobin